jgi:hypothetical protein
MSQVKYDTKSYKKTYNKKLAEQEEYCDACCMKVKLISMPKHKLSKKHIEKVNKQSSNLMEEVLEVLNNKSIKNDEDKLKQVYYLIQSQLFNEDGDEILPEEEFYSKPETKNKQEEDFCNQTMVLMNFEINEMLEKLEGIAKISTLETIDVLINKVDAMDRMAKRDLLSIYRRIMNELKAIDNKEEPKEPLKIIEQPITPKPILKKKVEIVVQEEDLHSQQDSIEDDFIPVARFYKMGVEEKQKHLEFLLNNYMGFFDNYYDDLADCYENVDNYDEYMTIYRKMVEIKDEKKEDIIDEEEEEEDNDFNYKL